MSDTTPARIGLTCAYTPTPLLVAAGFTPHRLLPETEAPDQASQYLHDNLCPHVKKVLDRALAEDLPELTGVVFMNSCDAMRRLKDAWQRVRPEVPALLLDLPTSDGPGAADYFAGELARLRDALVEWGGTHADDAAIELASAQQQRIAAQLEKLRSVLGARAMQEVYNRASAMPWDALEPWLDDQADGSGPPEQGVPVLLFGNVLHEVDALGLFEDCGTRIVDEDLCTGSRAFAPLEVLPGGDPALQQLARALLAKPPCARTVQAQGLGDQVVERARKCGARAVIGHSLKFCDPYLDRLPDVRQACQKAELPLLVLEGDCTLRSLGQQRTRIEAFVEMLR